MNKLKLAYDVVKTMKDKEIVKGSLKVEGQKNQVQVLNVANEFERNLLTGETKAKINTQVDYNGNKVKHESYTEFNVQDCHGPHGHHGLHGHHGFHGHPGFHGFKGPMHHPGCGHFEQMNEMKNGGFKEKLNRLSFMLGVLNQIKVTEQENKSLLLSFSSSDLPDEMKQAIQEKISCHQALHGQSEHPHHFMKDLFSLENRTCEFNVQINPKNEVEKVVITMDGQQENNPEETLTMNLRAELNFAW